MARAVVWAFRPISQLNGQTGFVECDEEVAKQLIDAELVQDIAVGGLNLKTIEAAPRPASIEPAPLERELDEHEYQTTRLQPESQHTTDLTPPRGRKSRR